MQTTCDWIRLNIIINYHSSDDYDGAQDKEYLRAVKDAARAKALRAKFEEWEATVGEDGGYINLTDENGCALETASKLKNRSDIMLQVVFHFA